MSSKSDLDTLPVREGAVVMIILVIAVCLEVDEAIAVIVCQVGALDRQFDMVGQRIADRGIEVERAAITFEHIVVAAGAVVVARAPRGRGADRQLAVVIIDCGVPRPFRSEEHTSELQSLMRISYAVFCLNKKTTQQHKSQLRTRLT